MDYYPAGTIILEQTAIVRQRTLPPHVTGRVVVSVDDEVPYNKVVAEGVASEDFRIIDIAGLFGIKRNDRAALERVIAVEPGDVIEAGTPLANPRRRRERKLVPVAPTDALVGLVEHGRIILQTNLKPIQVFARVPGVVTDLVGEDGNRGVQITSVGALIQCAWGNGRFAFGAYNMEPAEGLASLREQDSLLNNLRGRIYILERPLDIDDIRIALEKDLGGLVAPAMPYDLRETAMMLKFPVILTEGFGKRTPTMRTYEILRQFENERSGAFDAIVPDRWQQILPEIVLPVALQTATSTPQLMEQPLKAGTEVRLRCAPYDGQVAQVVELPAGLQAIENGLRVPAAQVKLRGGKRIVVPLANLEVMGDS